MLRNQAGVSVKPHSRPTWAALRNLEGLQKGSFCLGLACALPGCQGPRLGCSAFGMLFPFYCFPCKNQDSRDKV